MMRPLKALIGGMLLLMLAEQGMAAVTLLPEQIKNINLSNRSPNRVVCDNGNINDAFYDSTAKVTVKNDGKNSFISFLTLESAPGEFERYKIPTAFHYVCGGVVYSFIGMPVDRVDPQEIILGGNNIHAAKENMALMGAMPAEKQALFLLNHTQTDQLPASFSVTPAKKSPWSDHILAGIAVKKLKTVTIDGIPLHLTEYLLRARGDYSLDENLFLNTLFGTNIFAVRLDRLPLKKGEIAHLFIVEQEVVHD